MLAITITFKTYKLLIQNNLKLVEKTPHYNVNKFYIRIPEEIKNLKTEKVKK